MLKPSETLCHSAATGRMRRAPAEAQSVLVALRFEPMRHIVKAIVLVAALTGGTRPAAAEPIAESRAHPPAEATSEPFLLGPPQGAGPVVVNVRFELEDINDIDDEAEKFEFIGVMTLTWKDPRQAFDPTVAGVDEKVFQGSFQFDEISSGWYPQVVLVNESGLYEQSGVVLRLRPDGTSTLIATVNAAAEAEFSMRRFPFDSHRLEAVFEVLGFGVDEVALRVESDAIGSAPDKAWIPEWTVVSVDLSIRERPSTHAGSKGVASAFVVSVSAERSPFYIIRLVVLPLAIIVFLSFSVFWMDRSSLGDRISVSFIGILTAVAYQLVMGDHVPRIAYFTLIHGFLNLSFLTMCATVVVNLVVGAKDKRGDYAAGDRIDRRCRWAFPLVYVALNLAMLTVAFSFF